MGKKLKCSMVSLFLISGVLVLQQHIFARISNRVEGIIVDKVTNQPIEGAAIYLYQIRDDYSGITGEYNTETDKTGKFKFTDVRQGSYFLRCTKNEYVPILPNHYYGPWADSEMSPTTTPLPLYTDRSALEKTINIFRLDEGEIKHFRIAMEKGGKIKGKVSAKFKEGIYGFYGYISAYRKRMESEAFFSNDLLKIALTTSDDNGFFEIKDLPPSDEYYLRINFMNTRKMKRIDNIKVKASQTTDIDYIIDWTNTTGIKGKITFDGSVPKLGAITIFSINNEFVGITYMGIDGDYLLCELEPGKYIIEYTLSKYVSDGYKDFSIKIIETLSEGEIKEVNLDARSNHE